MERKSRRRLPRRSEPRVRNCLMLCEEKDRLLDACVTATDRQAEAARALSAIAAKDNRAAFRDLKNGRVTLEGVIDNEGDKNIANIRANSVPGVFSVTNNLQVVK